MSIIAGSLGCFVIWKRLSYFSDSISHSALLGVALMFFKIKLGYIIYVIFQLAYVSVCFVIIEENALKIIPLGSIAISLIYVALFTTQRKHLI